LLVCVFLGRHDGEIAVWLGEFDFSKYEIEQANDRGIGHDQGFAQAIEAYKRTLRSVRECAEMHVVDELAEEIKARLEEGERPSNRKVRRHARRLVSQAGYPADEYLNNA